MRKGRQLVWVLVAALLTLSVAVPTLALPVSRTQDMYRLYNPYDGQHLFTEDTAERDYLTKIGWRYEGVGWVAPSVSGTRVYRLYNKYTGDHHYTTSWEEYQYLGRVGWNQEGVGFYSDDEKGVAVYREYNPYAWVGTHNYTTSLNEHNYLTSIGWRDEGVCWYGVDPLKVTVPIGQCEAMLYADGELVFQKAGTGAEAGRKVVAIYADASLAGWTADGNAGKVVKVSSKVQVQTPLKTVGLFRGCSNLVDISGLGNWDVSHTRSFEACFDGCESLKDFSAIKSWGVSLR